MPHWIYLASANPFWIWAALAALLLAAEMLSGSGWLLWPATCAALVAILGLAMPMGAIGQIGLFAVLTILSTYGARRLWPPSVHEERDINDISGRLIGHRGKAVGAFANGTGRAFVDGKEWAAELEDGSSLAPGDPVEVTGLNGSRLRVRPAH